VKKDLTAINFQVSNSFGSVFFVEALFEIPMFHHGSSLTKWFRLGHSCDFTM